MATRKKQKTTHGSSSRPSAKGNQVILKEELDAPGAPRVLDWDKEDIQVLISNVQKMIPKNDHIKYSTAVDKLNWDKVTFKNYSDQDVKNKWMEIQSKLRRFRTLTDMVHDAKEWLKTPWTSYSSNRKPARHPDMPKKPLTPFFRYFMEKKGKMLRQNPGSSVTDLAKMMSVQFAGLSDKKRLKYKGAYEKEFHEYKIKMEKFRNDHPEIETNRNLSKAEKRLLKLTTMNPDGSVDAAPKKPRTPAILFLEEKLRKELASRGDNITNESKKELIESIKGDFSKLSDGKRIKWIRKSLEDEARYLQELEEYKRSHAEYAAVDAAAAVPTKPVKSILNKAEKGLKDKYDGKPDKPPNSGYALFSKVMLQKLTTSKDITSTEKMIQIAKRWKELSEEKRDEYNQDAHVLQSKYVEKLQSYLQTLPEEERSRLVSETKLNFPSKKKLKELETRKILADLENVDLEQLASDPAINANALCYYQQSRIPELQAKYPSKDLQEIIQTVFKEWHDRKKLSKKAKFLKQAAADSYEAPKGKKASDAKSAVTTSSAAAVVPSTPSKKAKKRAASPSAGAAGPSVAPVTLSSSPEKRLQTLKNIMDRAPKKPAGNSYSLFTAEMLPKLKHLDNKVRMGEVSRLWKEITPEAKAKLDSKAKDLNLKYQATMTKFKNSLSPEELHIYTSSLGKAAQKNMKKSLPKSSPVVSTAGAAAAPSSASKGSKNSKAATINPSDDLNVSQEVVINQKSEDSSEDSDDDDSDQDDSSEDEEEETPAPVVTPGKQQPNTGAAVSAGVNGGQTGDSDDEDSDEDDEEESGDEEEDDDDEDDSDDDDSGDDDEDSD